MFLKTTSANDRHPLILLAQQLEPYYTSTKAEYLASAWAFDWIESLPG